MTAAFTSGALASTANDLGRFEVQDGYGLGLMRIRVDGQELIGHVGEFMGSTAVAMVAPNSGEPLR